MRHLIVSLVVLSLFLTSAVDVAAQTAASDQRARLRDAQPSATPVHDAVFREGTRLGSAGRVQPAASISDRSWAGRHPVLLGALVGLGAGLAFTAGTGCAHSSDYTCGEFSLWFGGLGAGIGAGVGGIVALVRR